MTESNGAVKRPDACGTLESVARVEIQLPDDLVSKVEQAALEQGVSVEQLLRASVEEKIQRDAQFDAAVGKVLEKNAELYRRLS